MPPPSDIPSSVRVKIRKLEDEDTPPMSRAPFLDLLGGVCSFLFFWGANELLTSWWWILTHLFWKICIRQIGSSPPGRDEHKKICETTTWLNFWGVNQNHILSCLIGNPTLCLSFSPTDLAMASLVTSPTLERELLRSSQRVGWRKQLHSPENKHGTPKMKAWKMKFLF